MKNGESLVNEWLMIVGERFVVNDDSNSKSMLIMVDDSNSKSMLIRVDDSQSMVNQYLVHIESM